MCPFADMAWWHGNGIHLLARNSSTVRYQLCTVYSSVERVSKTDPGITHVSHIEHLWVPDVLIPRSWVPFIVWEPNYDIRTLFNTFKNVDTQDDGGEKVQATSGSQVLVLGKVYVVSSNIQRLGVPFYPSSTASKVQWVVLGFGLFFFKIKRSHKPFYFFFLKF
jgi:hypothetical protein